MARRVSHWSAPWVQESRGAPLASPWEAPRTRTMQAGGARSPWSEALPLDENFYARDDLARPGSWVDLRGFRAGAPSMEPGVGGGWRAFVSGMSVS